MTRAALYARYSDDKQSEASIEDQFRLCREHAGRERWQIVGSYEDAAISGASTILRPGIQRLMRDAQHGEFNILLAEALDRISRDQADVATLYKHLKFAGVTIVTLAEGEITELHVGLKGTMNALFLKDLAMKTHRGLRGRVEKGKAGGGLCYGYSVVKKLDASGEPIRGDREILPEEAEIVRRIFREFASGKSPKAIAVDLNRESIPGPLGRAWGDTSIRGHRNRGTGIVNNELYAGVLVWNRLRFVKDPSTGKRVSRPNPESAWIRTEVPHLRIVDDALWNAVRARQRQIAKIFGPNPANTREGRAKRLHLANRPVFLLSGLLARSEDKSLSFVYADDIDPEHRISMSLPITPESYGDADCRGYFANLLFEGPQLERALDGFGLDRGDIGALLWHLGADCPGAISVTPEGTEPGKMPGRFPEDYERLSDARLNQIVLSLHQHRRMPESERNPSPVAGVQGKIACLMLEGAVWLPKEGARADNPYSESVSELRSRHHAAGDGAAPDRRRDRDLCRRDSGSRL